MARPTKQGIDYFPLDCQFDDKIEMYLLETEAEGLAVLICVWQIIYSNEGYYTNNGNDLYLLVKKRVNVDLNRIKDCINVCLERDIFNKSLYKKHGILTSKAIQKRYFDAAKKKKEVRYNVNYIINGINVSENSINVCENATNINVNIKEDIDNRMEKFKLEVMEHRNEYSTEILEAFWEYWSEPNQAKTKMKKELQKTWDTKRRLKTWEKNSVNFGHTKPIREIK